MNRAVAEKNIVVLLFIAVLVAFSLADRDSKKLDKLYGKVVDAGQQQAALPTQKTMLHSSIPVFPK